MKRRKNRIWSWLVLICSGATLFQVFPITGTGGAGNYGCSRFATNSIGNAIDFCFIFDCENGFFGGLIDPCAPSAGGPLFVDCENFDAGDNEDDEDADAGN